MPSISSERSVATGTPERNRLERQYSQIRQTTEFLCHPLENEDYVVQPIEDVSPPKWHLGHTTWFFEWNILRRFQARFTPHHRLYNFIFNSYYESFGDRQPRPQRGALSRPTVAQVMDYREAIDERMTRLIRSVPERDWREFSSLTSIGLHHEQQHQELLVTDVKYILCTSPLEPVYNANVRKDRGTPPIDMSGDDPYAAFDGGLTQIGHGGDGFSFDNERPRHDVYLKPFRLRNRLVTNREYRAFIEDGGYDKHQYWLSDGWDAVRRWGWTAPLYWKKFGAQWYQSTLNGAQALRPDEPVCHVSHYEAAAYARWAGKRLPTEAEWEYAATKTGVSDKDGNFLDDHLYHPAPVPPPANGTGPLQMLGDVWEWTASPYSPYPGFQPEAGALSEYNGKFMVNQMVLRGGSCATPRSHIRPTYRNFFQSDKRWQFTGIRLADDA